MSGLAIQCFGRECPPFWTMPSGQGFDKESTGKVTEGIGEAIAQFRKSVTITFGRRLDVIQTSLYEVYRECSQDDWDGYGATAITSDAYIAAEKLVKLMPSSIQMPEITAEPSGRIGLEWYRGPDQVFIISVAGKHRIDYAGIFGANKIHGTEYFEEALPLKIIEHLRRLYS